MLSKRINDKLFENFVHKKEYDFPKKNLLIEVTNYCNNGCIFCYNHCMKRKRKFIDENLCKKVLVEAYELGSREVGFYVTGEPLLDNRLEDFIKFARGLGFSYIYLTTNGILADIERIKGLYKVGLNSIKYSINAINVDDYIFIHGTNNFDKVIKNLCDIYTWKVKNNINLKVYVSYIATNYTFDKEKIDEFFSNKCDEVVIMPAVNQGGLIPNINDKLSNNISTNINNKFSLPCNYPFNSAIITVEGYLTACCMDFENMLAYDDLNKTTLKDAWNNKIINEFRKKHVDGDVTGTLCQNCIFSCIDVPNPLSSKLCNINVNEGIFCNHLEKRLENR